MTIVKLFNDKLKEWENFYNYDRPHFALGGQVIIWKVQGKSQTYCVNDLVHSYISLPLRGKNGRI